MDNNKQNTVDNKPTQHLTPEQKQREKERMEREKKEEAELKKKLDEKLKKKKEKEKRIALKKKKEVKRVKSLINLPFRLHLQVSLLVTLLSAIVLFFGIELELLKTIYYSFIVFVLFYGGTGIVMIGIFFLISEEKLAEEEEQKRIENLNKVVTKSKEDLEIEEMALIEKEIAARKLATKLLKEENIDNIKAIHLDNDLDFINSNDTPNIEKIDLGLGSNSNDSIFDDSDEFDDSEIDFESQDGDNFSRNNQNTSRNLNSASNFDIFDDDEFLDIDLKKQKV